MFRIDVVTHYAPATCSGGLHSTPGISSVFKSDSHMAHAQRIRRPFTVVWGKSGFLS